MAVTAATLTTTVSESVTLNGKTFGNSITKTHASVKVVREQIVTVPTTMVTLYEAADDPSGTTFDEDLIVYARITNTDTTNFIGLHFSTKRTWSRTSSSFFSTTKTTLTTSSSSPSCTLSLFSM